MNDFLSINDNLIHKLAFVDLDNVILGTGNIIYPFAAIGAVSEFPNKTCTGKLFIGNNNIIREHVVISRGVFGSTVIGNNNYIMNQSYIAHDSSIEDNCTLACGSKLAGYVKIMNGSFIGMGSSIHQYSVIGSYSLLGMNTVVTKKSTILPGNIYTGIPAKLLKKNIIGLSRNNINDSILEKETIRYFKVKNEY